MSSALAVGAVKHKFNIPCGHMGTLDPMASGVLPVGVGKASRLFQYLLSKKKVYEAKFVFGFATDTLDITGQTTSQTSSIPTKKQLELATSKFVGEIMQVPPIYSAKCVNGKRGYELARRGVEFTLPPKKVKIDTFTLIDQLSENEFSFRIECEGGTYIRSLARDIAESLGSLGAMSSLKRTKCGYFDLENGVSVQEFKESNNPKKYLIEPDLVVDFPKIDLSNAQATKIINGVFENLGVPSGVYRVYNTGDFLGIGTSTDGVLKINAYVR
jgi:tRNA pseudouridine55 synthase